MILVYDVTNRSTFLSLQKWINEVRNYTASSVVCALVGNKCDLPEQREVSVEEAEEVCNLIPEILFQIETSAKENTNIENAFAKIAEELMVRGCASLFSLEVLILLLSEPPRQHRRRADRRHQARPK